MIETVLVAVEDTPVALRAAAVAVEIAGRLGCRLRVVTVLQDGLLLASLERASTIPALAERRERTMDSLLAHVAATAASSGVVAETCHQYGSPGTQILAEATSCRADLIVLGSSGLHRSSTDGVAARVVEFAEAPVLLVP